MNTRPPYCYFFNGLKIHLFSKFKNWRLNRQIMASVFCLFLYHTHQAQSADFFFYNKLTDIFYDIFYGEQDIETSVNTVSACDAFAGSINVPRVFFDANGNVAGNTMVDIVVNNPNEPTISSEDFWYTLFVVDGDLNVIRRQVITEVESGTYQMDLNGAMEGDFNVYGVLHPTDEASSLPNIGSNLSNFLADIDNCNFCGDYVIGALESGICVAPTSGNTPVLDGNLDSGDIYTAVTQYPFAAPLGTSTQNTSTDDSNEFSTFFYYENGSRQNTSVGRSGDIQEFHLTYDEDFLYLIIVGPSAFTQDASGLLNDEMDLFVAIDTDAQTGTFENLASSDAPLNKRVDFGGWKPEYFVVVEQVHLDAADQAAVYEAVGAMPVAEDTDASIASGVSDLEFTYNTNNQTTEIRLSWDILGGAPDATIGTTWHFALYTTYDFDGYDVYDSAPAVGQGTAFEVLGDDPGDADHCDTQIDPVTMMNDSGCGNCESDEGLGAGSDVGGMPMSCTTDENASPASDNSDSDFDTIEEYFRVVNLGQLEDVCCQDPEITNQPDDLRACDGDAVSFSISATGIDLTYQWQISSDGMDWTDLSDDGLYSGTDTPTLDISNTTGLDGRMFRVEVASSGNCIVYSDAATLTENPSPVITSQPENDINCPGEFAAFNVEASGNNSYRWQRSTNNGSSWSNLNNNSLYSGVTSRTLTIVNNSSENGNLFRVVITSNNNPGPNCIVTSDAAAVIHANEPVIEMQPEDFVTCGSGSATFNVTTTGNNLTYRWQRFNGSSWINLSNSFIYSGTTTSQLTINNTNGLFNNFFRVLVTENNPSGADCAITSESAQLVETNIDFTNCNNEVNLTLGNSCIAEVTWDLILEGDYNHEDFTITLQDANGNNVPNPITAAYACQQLTVTVVDNCSGSSCWGIINVEDKTDPVVNPPADRMFVACDEIDLDNLTPASLGFNFNSASDNCGPVSFPPEMSIGPVTGDVCTERIVLVTYRVTDACGNEGFGTQRLIYKRPSVVIPNGTREEECHQYSASDDNVCRPFLDFNGNGVFNGNMDMYLQEGELMCNFGLVSDVDEFDIECGNGFKRVYQYTVYDWCSENTLVPPPHPVHGQQQNPSLCDFKVQDKDDPTFSCPSSNAVFGINNPQDFFTGDFDCTATVTINPNATDACGSAITFGIKNIYVEAGTSNSFSLVDPEEYTVLTGSGSSVSFRGLECGSYYVEVQAVDDCGNATGVNDPDPTVLDRNNCRYYFEIVDDAAPIAICGENKSVSLNENCVAAVPDHVFDSGSFDNCALASDPFKVAKLSDDSNGDGLPEDNDFADMVTFNASDIDPNNCPTPGVMIVLRVRDAKGNTNFCMVEVELEDKIAPINNANINRARPCTSYAYLFDEETTEQQIHDALNQELGAPGGTDNCDLSVNVIDMTVTINEEDCNQGKIIRRFRVEDVCGNRSEFTTQTLDITESRDWTMTFPFDAAVECESFGDVPPPALVTDIVMNNGCDEWAMSVDSSLFEFEEDVCYKLVREYTLINWCNFNNNSSAFQVPRTPNGNSDLLLEEEGDSQIAINHLTPGHNNDFIKYTQIIKVNESTPPTVAVSHLPNCDEDGDCEEQQTFVITGADPCSPRVNVNYYFVGDIDNDGVPETSFQNQPDSDPYGDIFGDNIDFSIIGVYPIGRHKLVIEAEDICGNLLTEDFFFIVEDCEAPEALCIQGLEVILPPENMFDVQASQFDIGSSDSCSEPLQFSFSPDVNETTLTLECEDLGTVDIDLWVTDQDGNQAFCNSFIEVLRGNPDFCPTGSGSSAITGAIWTENQQTVSDVTVNVSGQMDATVTTGVEGTFAFTGIQAGQDYTITPERNTDAINGVTTFDLVLIRKHILGIEPFISPYKLIAADANNSGSVTTFDMVTIRKLILNIVTEFPSNSSWRFVDADYVFLNNTNPWEENFPEIININDLPPGILETNFVAIKIGDVNGSAVPNLFETDERGLAETFFINVPQQSLKAGTTITIPFTTKDVSKMEGMQFSLYFNPAVLALQEIKQGIFQEENFGKTYLDEGYLTCSWNKEKDLTTDHLFDLVFDVKSAAPLAEVLDINSDFTLAEAYPQTLETPETWNMNLRFLDSPNEAKSFILYQNQPNPFSNNTIIAFELPDDSQVTLKIRDIAGKLVYQIKNIFEKGYQQIELNRADLGDRGVFYYEVETEFGLKVRKMMVF